MCVCVQYEATYTRSSQTINLLMDWDKLSNNALQQIKQAFGVMESESLHTDAQHDLVITLKVSSPKKT